jgi:very-short-patch-repair endonuclease
MFNNNRLNPDDANVSPIAVGAATASVVGAVSFAHKSLLNYSPTYAKNLYNFTENLENKSPGFIFKTASLSEMASAHIVSSVHIPHENLFVNSHTTPLAEHLKRLIGTDVNLAQAGGLTFNKLDKTGYLSLSTDPSVKVKFYKEGRLGTSSVRYGAPISTEPYEFVHTDNPLKDLWSNFQALRSGQKPKGLGTSFKVQGLVGQEGEVGYRSISMLPVLAERDGKPFSNFITKFHRIAFGLVERPQQNLFAEFGIGVKAGSYNKILHIPFLEKNGRGIINELLSKRVLPAYLIAGVALPYLDYKLHHLPSNTAVNAFQAVTLARAKATDETPGLRSITDTYARVIPGPQYGPVALPLGGMVAGALIHYGNVLRDKYPHQMAREAAFRIFAKGRDVEHGIAKADATFLKIFNKASPVAKGLVAGLALMIPFIPGMIGSRKSEGELQDIYSGNEPVPIRTGRWWDMGITPFSGSTIKEWRPHWSVLWKAQAEKASIYGSEEAYWAHHPLVSPVTAFKDPYWLEKQNYEDRPYPVTSPAFSNVPIIGPFLAATIGKLVKPVRRMHTDEWDGKSDYNLYSSLLEPRGGAVDSPFERDISVQLAERGYKSSPQTPIGNYRADFTLEGNGHKVVLEADSTTYHGKWNAAADAKRQAEIEAAGWDVIRVKSKSFFSDSSAAMAPVFSRLQALGIEPEKAGGNIQSGLVGLANPTPKDEFGLRDTIDREAYAFSDFMGLHGFIGRSVWAKLFPDQHKDVFLQSSRQIDSLQRRYYERELGAGYFMSPEGRFAALGYTEPLRRFIQNEQNTQQANEIPNSLANVGWIPGANAYKNFKKGDPYSALEDGYARLPGPGYESLHPELKGLDPNDYPDINKLSILSDIAPYSREYQAVKGRVAKSAQYNPDLEIEYSRILDRVRQTKDSALGTTNRIFSGRTDSVEGTIDSANQYGVSVKEYPGRTFRLSGLGMSAADMAAISIGENNNITREALDDEVQGKRQALGKYLQDALAPGTHVSITVPRGSIDSAEEINAVFRTSSDNINAELIDRGYARFDRRNAGPEARDLFGGMTQAFGTIGEELAFTGDEEVWNPLRYVPTPAHTKFWQNKDPLSDYLDKEVYGSRMRRWDKPLHDFLMPYVRGAVKRATGYVDVPEEVEEKRNLNTITDSLKYLRSKILADKVPGERSKYTNQGLRTFEGVDLFSESSYVASTLPRREAVYFTKFVKETDPEKRQTILASVSAPTAEALEAQWLKAKTNIDLAEGKETGPVGQDGRILTKEGLEAYKNANTKLNYGDFSRSVEIAKAFTDKNYNIPDMNSDVFSPNLDYEDVKLKILQLEGYDAKDFNIFDDRSNTLWRKPYIDGAVRELTAGTNRTLEANRQIIESMLLASNNRDPKVTMTSSVSRTSSGNTKVDIERDDHDNLIQNMRRNPELYN